MTLANVQFIERNLLVKKTFFILLVLLIITIVGFLVRIYRITEIPSGFFADEASTGYNAYSILKTGKDEFGERFPIFFESFGNYRPGIPFYFTVPSIKLFGLNEFSTRLPSAIIGTLTILIIFFLSTILFRSNTSVGLLSALFLSISPWHIHFSRYGAENIYLPFLLSLSVLLFLIAINQNKTVPFLLAFLSFALGFYTYFQAYYLIPLFLILLLIIYKNEVSINKKNLILGLLLFFLLSLPLLRGAVNGNILSRYRMVSSANQGKTIKEIANTMTSTYIDHFRPEFLFENGDIGFKGHFITRFSVRNMGELYWFQLPLILFGIINSFRYKKSFFLILGWLLLYPLGSTLAPFADGGGPFATRSIIGVIPFQILSAIGLIYFLSFFKRYYVKSILFLLFLIIMLFSFKNYAYKYFVQYNGYSSDFWGWQYGPRDIINYYLDNESKYDELVMMPEFNAPSIFFKFYAPEQCDKCKVGTPDMSFNPNKNQLFVVTQAYLSNNPSIDFKTVKTINYPNGLVAFRIGEVVQ